LEAADLVPFEQVDIYNINNGARFTTYVIPGRPGEVTLNGAAARHVAPGDLVIVACYAQFNEAEVLTHRPSLVFVDAQNKRVLR